MKTDLEKIAAALKKLESLNNSSNQQPAKSQPSIDNVVREEKSSDNSAPHAIPPISVQQSQRKTPTLPAFNFPSISDRLPIKEPVIPSTELLKAPDRNDPVLLLAQEQQIVQQIQELYQEGPIVDGYLESYYPSAPKQDLIIYDATQPSVAYVEAVGSSEVGKVTCEAPRSAYRLCGVHPSGQKWAYPCPLEQLASVSMAIARYEKLVQLLERRQAITTRLSEVAT